MKNFFRAAAGWSMMAAAGCAPGALYSHDEPIDGPYRLRADLEDAELHVCYERASGVCELRIPGRVFAIGHDDDFIVAAVHPLNIQSEKRFYYVVRDFDGPRADVARAVRGPFENDAFVKEMKEHGVPAPELVIPPR
jgi:hypothetical protein